jgi:hypothetical protein
METPDPQLIWGNTAAQYPAHLSLNNNQTGEIYTFLMAADVRLDDSIKGIVSRDENISEGSL